MPLLRRPRIAALLALASLLALAVSACGGSSSSPSASAGTTSTASTTAGGASATGQGSGTTGKTSTGSTSQKDPQHGRRRSKKAVPAGQPSSRARRHRVRVGASKLRECLGKYGIHSLQDPQKGASREKLRAALARCAQGSSGPRRLLLSSPSYRKALTSFANCMRTHGVHNFPAPNTSGNGPIFAGARLARNPQLVAADKACIHLLATVRG